MVSTTFAEQVNYIKDIDFEYNIKLFIILVMWLYFVFVIWFSFRLNVNRFWASIWKLISRVIAIPYVALMPLFSYFLLRAVEFEILYNYMLVFYVVFLTIWFILFLLAVGEFSLALLGFDVTPSRYKNKFLKETPFDSFKEDYKSK